MSTWPDTDDRVVMRYLATLRLRSPNSRTYYRQALCSFQDVARRHQKPSVGRLAIETWLREWGADRHPSTLLHRANIVDRFLDHLVREGAIASNPVADLCAEYAVKQSRPILRALAGDRPDEALEALRRHPPFGSTLGGLMLGHVKLMRSRGYRYEAQEAWFLRFDRFLQEHPALAREPVDVMLQQWAVARHSAHHAAECEKLGRALTRAQRALDPNIKPRRPDPRPHKAVERTWRKPHIFSPADIRRLLDIACTYPSALAPLRPISVYTMLVLAYCAGLRRSELARLDLGDVDLLAGTITIRETKFFKTRILPLPDSVVADLRDFLAARRRAKAPQHPQSGLFWHEQGNVRYTPQAIGWLLVDILRRADLKPREGRIGPRIHDLRHSMVVNRMLGWYRAGINPQDRLPYLAAYLGHRDIHSTLVYITVTQDLLQQASERFRSIGASRLNIMEGVGHEER